MHLDEASKFYNQSLGIARQLNDQNGVAANLHNLAIVAQEQAELGKAEQLYHESLTLSERLGDPRSVAISLHQLGVINEETGNLVEAREFFERSLETKMRLGDQNGMAGTLHQLGLLTVRMGGAQEGRRLPFPCPSRTCARSQLREKRFVENYRKRRNKVLLPGCVKPGPGLRFRRGAAWVRKEVVRRVECQAARNAVLSEGSRKVTECEDGCNACARHREDQSNSRKIVEISWLTEVAPDHRPATA